MRFGRDRAEAHGAGAEALDDLARGFDLVERNRAAGRAGLELEKPAQRCGVARFGIGVFGKLAIGVAVIAARGDLQGEDRRRIPFMLLAGAAPVEVARVRQRRCAVVLVFGITDRMPARGFAFEHVETHALQAARRPGESELDDLVGEAERFENLCALVGRQGRDAHLGHDLEHPFGDALPIGFDELRVGGDHAFFASLPEGLEREIRVDGIGAVADQQAVVVHFARFAALEHDADPCALLAPYEMVVDGAAGEQGTQRDAVRADAPVGEHHDAVAVVDRLFGFAADPLQRGDEAAGSVRAFVRDVDRLRTPAEVVHRLDRRQVLVGQDRMAQTQTVRVPFARREQVALGADVALERHDDFFADRVDRRVRDLREQLLEVVVEHPRTVAQAGQRAVVAHRTHGIAKLLDQRLQHELHGLGREAESLHPREQRVLIEAPRRSLGFELVERQPLGIEPLCIGMPPREFALEFVVGNEPALFEVDQEHAARFESALGLDVARVDRHDADLARHDDAVVVRQVVPARTQAVAVEHGAYVVTVGKGDRSRAVPGFHDAGLVLVERAPCPGHEFVALPGLRDHHHHRFLQRSAGHEQELEHVVEDAGVGAVGLGDREQIAQRAAEQPALHDAFAGLHPVLVAAQRVDLAVVAHESVGLGAVPARKGVRREPRVHHGQVALVVRVVEIVEEVGQLARRQHALVDQHLRREAADIEGLGLNERRVASEPVACALADQVELALESVALEPVAGRDHELLDVRCGRHCRSAEIGPLRVDRDLPPAYELLTFGGADPCDFGLAVRAFGRVGRQKDDPGGKPARSRQLGAEILADHLAQELVRQRREDACAVAGVGLGAAGAAVIHPAQQMIGIADDPVTAFALDVSHEADAAAIVLVFGPVKAAGLRGAGAAPAAHRLAACGLGMAPGTDGNRPACPARAAGRVLLSTREVMASPCGVGARSARIKTKWWLGGFGRVVARRRSVVGPRRRRPGSWPQQTHADRQL